MPQRKLIEKIADESNLKNAWVKSRYFAKTSGDYFDIYAYQEFENNLDAYIATISFQLLHSNYVFGNLRIIEIPKGEDTRKIYFSTPRDAVVSQAIINVVGPIFEEGFSNRSFGNRLSYDMFESKSPFLDWFDQYTKYMSASLEILLEPDQAWYQISDIEKFYPSINLIFLMERIANRIGEPECLFLIEKLLELQAVNSKEEIEDIKGVPAGTAYSHFFANVYLDIFDKFIETKSLFKNKLNSLA